MFPASTLYITFLGSAVTILASVRSDMIRLNMISIMMTKRSSENGHEWHGGGTDRQASNRQHRDYSDYEFPLAACSLYFSRKGCNLGQSDAVFDYFLTFTVKSYVRFATTS
jgi:hypothetical protein